MTNAQLSEYLEPNAYIHTLLIIISPYEECEFAIYL